MLWFSILSSALNFFFFFKQNPSFYRKKDPNNHKVLSFPQFLFKMLSTLVKNWFLQHVSSLKCDFSWDISLRCAGSKLSRVLVGFFCLFWYSWSPLITALWLSFLCVFSSPSTRLAHKPLQIGPRRSWGIYNQDHNIIFNKVSSFKMSHLKLDMSLSSSGNNLGLLLSLNSWL